MTNYTFKELPNRYNPYGNPQRSADASTSRSNTNMSASSTNLGSSSAAGSSTAGGSTSTTGGMSLAERELRSRYGGTNSREQPPVTTQPPVNTQPVTILYDPFEDKRIELPTPTPTSDVDSPVRPNTLDLSGAGTSRSSNTAQTSSPTQTIGTSMTAKQVAIYEQSQEIEMENFPEPPPAYSEFAITEPEPPRTQVITVPPSPTSNLVMTANGLDRKSLQCPTCGCQVSTIVHKSVGLSTHCLGIGCFFIGCWPITAWVYLGKTFKENYHFCPNCNTRVGREVPFLGLSMFKTKEVHSVG